MSGTSTTQTIPATTASLLNFTQGTQQSIFASPNQGQQSTFGVGLGKIPSKSESSGITMPTFFSGASKSSESSQGQCIVMTGQYSWFSVFICIENMFNTVILSTL